MVHNDWGEVYYPYGLTVHNDLGEKSLKTYVSTLSSSSISESGKAFLFDGRLVILMELRWDDS
jgi:hypothetical protein